MCSCQKAHSRDPEHPKTLGANAKTPHFSLITPRLTGPPRALGAALPHPHPQTPLPAGGGCWGREGRQGQEGREGQGSLTGCGSGEPGPRAVGARGRGATLGSVPAGQGRRGGAGPSSLTGGGGGGASGRAREPAPRMSPSHSSSSCPFAAQPSAGKGRHRRAAWRAAACAWPPCSPSPPAPAAPTRVGKGAAAPGCLHGVWRSVERGIWKGIEARV